MQREEMIPDPPPGLDSRDRSNFVRHFRNRKDAEERWLGVAERPDVPTLEVASPAAMNSADTVRFAQAQKADLAVVFGTGMIRDPLFGSLPPTVNLHLGLSPRYRGSATLFWPFYFLEPAWAGSTFHFIVDEPDAGPIVHQVVPELERGDGIHDVAAKTLLASAGEAEKLLRAYERDGRWQTVEQRSTGKNFLARDFRPVHLRVVYDLFDDRIVDAYLDGALPATPPPLVTF
jgi:methionyl-tRNA formyltransferase